MLVRPRYILAIFPALLSALMVGHCSKGFPGSDFLPFAAVVAGITTQESDPDGFTIGGSAAGLNGSVDLTNQGETITVSADGDFVFNTRYVSTSTYNVTASNATNNMQCSINNASGTVAQANVTDVSIVCTSEYDPAGAPAVVTTNPQNGATSVPVCSGTTCRARVYLYFDQSMDSSLTPTLTATIDGTAVTVAVAAHNWFNNTYVDDSLEVELSWVHFPVNSTPTLTFQLGPLQDKGGTSITADYALSFTTGNGHYYALADSGQTNCTDLTALIGCPHTTFGQDGDYAGTARSFTRTNPIATDFITTDNVTGLVWQSCPEGDTYTGPGCAGAASSLSWYAAFANCAALNTANAGAGYGNFTDWRVPSMRELRSIFNYGVNSPNIDTASFATTPTAGGFWSSTTDTSATGDAFAYNIANGITQGVAKATPFAVRCVRGSGTTAASLTDNGDDTITDNITGLVWTKCVQGWTTGASACDTGATNAVIYNTAVGNCDTLNFGGRTDWRLPSMAELHSIVDDTRTGPALDPTYFPSPASSLYSSTPDSVNYLRAFYLDGTGSAESNVQFVTVTTGYRCVAN